MFPLFGRRGERGLRIGLEMISAGEGIGVSAGGMIVYYGGLLGGLVALDEVEEVVVFAPENGPELDIFGHRKVRLVRCLGIPRKRWARVVYEQTLLPWKAFRNRVDVLLSTCNTRPLLWTGPSVVVLQSLQFMMFKQEFSALRRLYLRAVVSLSLRTADVVIAVSDFEREEAVRLFRVPRQKVRRIYHGLSDTVRSAAEAPADPPDFALELGHPYMITVSTLYEHKNHARLIRAFARAVHTSGVPHALVIVGGDADVTRRQLQLVARDAGIAERVRFLGAVPHDSVSGLLKGADAAIYPSLYETFGHPIVEALALGLPLGTSSRGAAAEVAGSAARLFNPYDVESIAVAIVDLLTDDGLRRRLSRDGPERARGLTWDRTARLTLTALRTAADLHRAGAGSSHARGADTPPRGIQVLSVIHYPIFGGPHNRQIHLARALEPRNMHVTVVVPAEAGNAFGRLKEEGVDVARLRLHRMRKTLNPLVHLRFLAEFPSEVRALRDLIRKRSAGVVVINGLVNPHAAVAARLEGVPVVWQILDSSSPGLVGMLLMRLVTKMADALMFNGPSLLDLHLQGRPAAVPVGIYYPAVDVSRFYPSADRRVATRRELGIPADAPVVGMVANLNPMKGIEYFVRAAGRIYQARPETWFFVVGARYRTHSSYTRRLTAEVRRSGVPRERFIFVGYRSDVERYYPAMDVKLITSVPHSEGTTTTALEAMACGIAVVAADVGGVRDVVEHGVTGLLVPPLDPNALAAAALGLLADEKVRQRYGQAGPRRVAERFGPEACADAHAVIIAAAIERRSGRRSGYRARGRAQHGLREAKERPPAGHWPTGATGYFCRQ